MVKKNNSIMAKNLNKSSTRKGKDEAHVRAFMKIFKDVAPIHVGRKGE